MKNKENLQKKIHIVIKSIVKINLSTLPSLSHFRDIGETFRKFNRNPSAFQSGKFPHSDIHEGAINTAAGQPVQHWRHQHHQAERVAHQNYTIREEAGQSTKTCFYMANNRVGERPR